MKHRHLNQEGFTPAAIEDILDRGRMPDGAELIAVIQADPFGKVAEETLALCELEELDLHGAPVFRRVIAQARKPQPDIHDPLSS